MIDNRAVCPIATSLMFCLVLCLVLLIAQIFSIANDNEYTHKLSRCIQCLFYLVHTSAPSLLFRYDYDL
jgi:hypothetical protein